MKMHLMRKLCDGIRRCSQIARHRRAATALSQSCLGKAAPVSTLEEPIICEDSDAGVMLFTYEIGAIKNVSLFTILKLNCVNGVITTHSKTETLSKSTSDTYNLSSSSGGSKSTVNTAAGAFELSQNMSHTDTSTVETGQNFELSVNGKLSGEVSASIPIAELAGANIGGKKSYEIGGGINYGNYIKKTETGTDSWSGGLDLSLQRSKAVMSIRFE